MIIWILGGILTLAVVGIGGYIFNNMTYFERDMAAVWRAGFVEKQLMINGSSLNYAEGPNNGPVLLLIHGQAVDWKNYAKVLPKLSQQYHVFAIDCYGHGNSAHVPEKYSTVAMGTDIATFIEKVIGEPVLVSGHSSGGLLAAWLAAGPTSNEYGEVIDQTLTIWDRIASPNAVDWANRVLEAMVDSPCADESKRTSAAVVMIEGVRQHASRLTFRQRVEVEGLAADFGLPTREVDASANDLDVWAKLDGKMVGIYSLLTRAEGYLRARLSRLCSVGEVRGNSDQVATQALRSLAERADFLVVDTWHAAHQATGAIDAVRPRDRQILPRQRGHSGFLRALEDALGG